MARQKSIAATMVRMLVYFDEPQVVLLEYKDDHKIIAVGIDKKGYEFAFLGAEINEKQWERYYEGSVDLRYLFLLPRWKRWYIFDLGKAVNKKVTIFRAEEDDYKSESFLPTHGFFSRDHTEPDSRGSHNQAKITRICDRWLVGSSRVFAFL